MHHDTVAIYVEIGTKLRYTFIGTDDSHGAMCQSATALRSLLPTSTLQHWTEHAITLCEDERCFVKCYFLVGGAMRLVALAGIVECLRALCSIEEVVDYLDSPRGSALFKPLITCISVGRGHRERISNILCSLLKNERTLNGAVQQMVLKCVLDDETITVKLIDEKAPSFFLAFNFKSEKHSIQSVIFCIIFFFTIRGILSYYVYGFTPYYASSVLFNSC
uniref:Rep_fac_C domain-containing protein n=1 Tax=Ascaris lumbricoides TaxID=6252 RepID=A0A0M3HTT7_ASCLU